jgi:hypothetical protein
MTIMCLNSRPGANTSLITLNGARADEVFGQYTKGRDSKDGFGPGAIVVITRPNPIENYMGDRAGLPVLSFSGGLKLVDAAASKIVLSKYEEVESVGRLHGFYYPKVKLMLMNANIGHTNCVGRLCDSIGMKKEDGTWLTSCPCYSHKKSVGYCVLDLNLYVVALDDAGNPIAKFYASDFTSRKFTDAVTKSGIPLGTNMSNLEIKGADVDMAFNLEDLIDKVNSNGGFSVLGWVRRGMIKDQSMKGEAGKNEVDVMVQSGTLAYHLTHVGLNCNDEQLKTLKKVDFDMLLKGEEKIASVSDAS